MRTKNREVWVEVTVATTPAAGEMVGELLNQAGCGGVVYHDPCLYEELKTKPAELLPATPPADKSYRVTGYLPLEPGWEGKVQSLQTGLEGLRAFLPVGSGEVTIRQVQEEDWANAWKAYYRPEQVGPFLITPSWLSPVLPPGAIEIRLDPGMAFGAGTHPTTQLCLALLPQTVKPGALVYDIGTGSGILAIAAAKLGAKVMAVDRDPVAVAVAAANFARNRVAIPARTGDLLSGLTLPADLIIANILAEVVITLIPQAMQRLKPGGALLVSGIIDRKAERCGRC